MIVDLQLRTEVSQVLSSLFKTVEPDLKLDESGMVALGFQDGFVVTLEVPPAGSTLYAHAAITRLPLAGAEGAMRRALERNLFNIGSPDMWIALDAESLDLTLCATLSATGRIDEDMLSNFLAGMIEVLRDLVREFGRGPEAPARAEAYPADLVFIRS